MQRNATLEMKKLTHCDAPWHIGMNAGTLIGTVKNQSVPLAIVWIAVVTLHQLVHLVHPISDAVHTFAKKHFTTD